MRVRLTKAPSAFSTQVVSASEAAAKPLDGVLRAWRRHTAAELAAELAEPRRTRGALWFAALPIAASVEDAVRKGGKIAFLSDGGVRVVTSSIESISADLAEWLVFTRNSQYTIARLPPPRPPPYAASENSPVLVVNDETSRVQVKPRA